MYFFFIHFSINYLFIWKIYAIIFTLGLGWRPHCKIFRFFSKRYCSLSVNVWLLLNKQICTVHVLIMCSQRSRCPTKSYNPKLESLQLGYWSDFIDFKVEVTLLRVLWNTYSFDTQKYVESLIFDLDSCAIEKCNFSFIYVFLCMKKFTLLVIVKHRQNN